MRADKYQKKLNFYFKRFKMRESMKLEPEVNHPESIMTIVTESKLGYERIEEEEKILDS